MKQSARMHVPREMKLHQLRLNFLSNIIIMPLAENLQHCNILSHICTSFTVNVLKYFTTVNPHLMATSVIRPTCYSSDI